MSQDHVEIAGVVVTDATREGCPVTYVSPGFEQLTGYAAADMLGRGCSVLQGPDTDPRAVEVLRHAIASGTEAYVTILNYRADGTPFWNEVALAPQRDADGCVVRYLGVQKDVTARRLADGFHVDHATATPTGHNGGEGFDAAGAADELARIIAGQQLTTVFQPIVDIESAAVIGYEALARGPEGSSLQRPDRLFAAARAAARVDELDWLCRATAVRAALAAGLGRSAALFLNCEPSTIGSPCPEVHAGIWGRAAAELDLVLEITERALTDRPAELSREVAEHRSAGRSIALDDIGADVRSLALLPLIEPDVIKLDLRLVQDRPSTDQAAIVSAVAAERERTGASILAEGIEDDNHLAVARALGATLGQGWLWGRPGPLPSRPGRPWTRRLVEHRKPTGGTPFEVIAAVRPTASATKSLLLPMSHHLENRALPIGEGAVVLAAFQDAKHFTTNTMRRYEMLARGASLVAAFGVGLGEEPIPGVRGANIDPDDPLAGEWSVIVIGPHFAGALVAQDLGDTGRERDRRFLFGTTYDRGLVIAAARTLLGRIAPVSLAPDALIR
jgi:PAS domain S-box-containing protein